MYVLTPFILPVAEVKDASAQNSSSDCSGDGSPLLACQLLPHSIVKNHQIVHMYKHSLNRVK
jgi:hypothetical protein